MWQDDFKLNDYFSSVDTSSYISFSENEPLENESKVDKLFIDYSDKSRNDKLFSEKQYSMLKVAPFKLQNRWIKKGLGQK